MAKPTSSTTSCKSKTRCYCEIAATAVARGVVTLAAMTTSTSSGVSVGWKWVELRVKNLTEKVKLKIVSVVVSPYFGGEEFENIEDLKQL